MQNNIPWLFFGWRGRIDRLHFWAAMGGLWIASTPIYGLMGLVARPLLQSPRGAMAFAGAMMMTAGYVRFAIMSKRLHDMGRSAWWCWAPIAILLVATFMLASGFNGRLNERMFVGLLMGSFAAMALWGIAEFALLLWLGFARSRGGDLSFPDMPSSRPLPRAAEQGGLDADAVIARALAERARPVGTATTAVRAPASPGGGFGRRTYRAG
jgi:uncharacterized membrane protein YhaH (DUF805 family)